MPNTEIKLIATDLDGTLLRDDHLTLSPANREALTSAAKAGIEVVIATGRSLAAVAPQVLELPFLHYFITCNGSHNHRPGRPYSAGGTAAASHHAGDFGLPWWHERAGSTAVCRPKNVHHPH